MYLLSYIVGPSAPGLFLLGLPLPPLLWSQEMSSSLPISVPGCLQAWTFSSHQCVSLHSGLNVFFTCESHEISAVCEQPETQTSHICGECTSSENVGGTTASCEWRCLGARLFLCPFIRFYFNFLALVCFTLNMWVHGIVFKEVFDSLCSRWGDVCFSPASSLWFMSIFRGTCGGSLRCF